MHKIIGLLVLIVASSFVLAKRNDDFSPAYGLRFSSNSHVSIPGFNLGSSFTIEFMIRWTNNGGPVVSLAKDSNNKDKVVVSVTPIQPSNGRVTVAITDGAGVTHDVSYDGIPINTWTYVAVVATAKTTNTQIQFYTQSESSNSPSLAGAPQTNTRLLPYSKKNSNYFGRSGSSLFSGDLDEVKIWSISLNSDQLGRGKKPSKSATGLIGYWSFNEGSGNTVADGGKNCLSGTLSNPAPVWINSAPTRVGTCQVWGRRVSISTFDNTAIRYKKLGDYYLSNGTDINFQIRVDYARNRFCSAVTALAFTYKSTSVVIDADFSSKADSIVYINKLPYLLDSYSNGDGLVMTKTYTRRSHTYYITGQNPSFELKVEALPRSGVVNVLLKLSSDPYGTKVAGLCGNFDGLADNTNPNPVVPTSDSLFESLFTRPTPSGDSTFECVPPPALQSDIDRVCGDTNIVDDTLYDSCVFDVCAAQDITAATFSAEVTYNMNCNDSIATGNCAPPCPGFCSFQGTCVNGVCQCTSQFGGIDCSERKNVPCLTAYWPQGSATLDPFIGSVSGIAHYSYDRPNSDSSATDNEISDATVIYFYQNAADNGTSTSMIFINDMRRDGSGGKAQATITGTYSTGTRMSFNNNDIVKDDPGDTYTNSNGVVTANWKWEPCCTDGIAITKIPLSQPFCLNMTITPTSGLSQLFFAEQNLFGEQDLVSVPITGSSVNVAVCSQNCDNICTSYSSCSQCLSDLRCGWCSETSTCEKGSAAGPRSGRCSFWRYSNTSVSRVVTTTLAYPVDPAVVDVFVKPNTGLLPVNFYVNFPPLTVVPHEVVTLVELTGSWLELTLLKLTLVWALNTMTDNYPLVRLGLASFSDKPISPYGSSSRGDYAYRTDSPLTTNLNSVQRALNSLSSLDGGDSAQSQLEALLQLSVRDEMGWTLNARHTVIVITRSAFHTPVGSPLNANNGDGILNANEDYPSVDQVRRALLDRNVYPIFIVNSAQENSYNNLVNSLGFGRVIAFSRTDFLGALTDTLSSLDTMAGSAKAVIRTPGKVSSVSNEFSGLSPYTRATFTAMVNTASTSTDPAVIVVPGFGKLTINYVNNDLPVTEGCTAASISSTETKIIRLGGSSPLYGGVVRAQITAGPTFGRFYQYVNGQKGDALDSTGFVTDAGLRVIYDPISPTANGTATYKFKILDECASCSTEQACGIDVTASVFPPVALPEAPRLTTEANTVSAPFTIDGTNSQGPVLPKVVRIPNVGTLYRCQAQDCQNNAQWDEITEQNKLVPSKKIRYSPPRGTVGAPENFVVDTFSYRVKDTATGLESSDACIELAVIPTNAPDPIANSSIAPVSEDTPSQIDLIAGTAGTFTFIITSLPPTGAGDLSPVNDIGSKLTGTGPWDLPTPSVYFFPAQNFDQTTSFNFKLYDANTDVYSNEATVEIRMLPINDAPTNQARTYTPTMNDENFSVTLEGSDIDSTGLTYYLCSYTGSGTLSFADGSPIAPGNYNNNKLPLGSNIVRYKSPLNQHPTESFDYTVYDGELFASPCATITLQVQRLDIAPVAQSGGVFSMNQSAVADITLVGYDANQEDNPLDIVICQTASRGLLTQTTGAAIADGQSVLNTVVQGSSTIGHVYFNTTGIYDFGAGYAWFTYKVVSSGDDVGIASSACVNVTINVNNLNDAPIIQGPSSPITLAEDSTSPVTLDAWDPDGDVKTYRFVTVPVETTEGSLFNGATRVTAGYETTTNTFEFVPVLNYNGATTFSFQVFDPSGATSNTRTVGITVTPVNDAPTANSDTFSATEDQTEVLFSISGYDVEPYNVDTFTYDIVALPSVSIGSLFVCNPVCNTAAAVGTIASRNLRFVPAANQFGTATLTFKVIDTEGLPSDNTATVSIVIAPVNDKPVPSPLVRNVTVLSSDTVLIVLGGTDVENDQLTVTITNIGQVLGAVKNAGTGTDVPVSTGFVSDPNLTIRYVPNRNVNNTSPYTQIYYRLADSEPANELGLVNIFVVNADLPPTSSSVTFSGTEEANLPITLTGTDPDGPGTTVEFVIETVPPVDKGVLRRTSDDSLVTDGSSVADGNLYFVPVTDGQGIGYTSFTYHVTNNGLNSATYTVTIDLANVPDPPTVSSPTSLIMNEDSSLTIELVGFDPDGDSVVLQIIDAPNTDAGSPDIYKGFLFRNTDLINPLHDGDNITVQPALVVYQPHPNRFTEPGYGTGFQVIAIDSTGRVSAPFPVNIQVNAVNDPPIAIGSTLNAVNNNFNGYNVFSVSVSDLDCPPGVPPTIIIDQLPVVGKMYYTTTGGVKVEVTQANNNFTGVTFEYVSFYYGNDAFSNYDNFTFRAFDGFDYSNTARTFIDIIVINYIPTPNFATPIQCIEDTVCQFTMNAIDLDAGSGSSLRWYINTTTSYGTMNTTFGSFTDFVTNRPNRQLVNSDFATGWVIKYTPNANYYTDSTQESFAYTVRDGGNLQGDFYRNNQLTFVNINVLSVNDAPVLTCTTTTNGAVFGGDNTASNPIPGIILYRSTITAVDVDARPTDILSGSVVCSSPNASFLANMYFNDPSGLTYFSNATFGSLFFNGTLQAIQTAFASGYMYVPFRNATDQNNLFNTITDNCTVTINDNGNFGQANNPLSGSCVLNVKYMKGSFRNINNAPSGYVAGAVAGSTTLVSAGIYGVYKLLKKKKILPEDADPWETDEYFDQTTDNPLYSGTPTTSSAANVTLVTNDI